MGVRHRLDEVYRRVPTLRCKGLCQDVCGPVPASHGEVRLMERTSGRRYGWQLRTGHCSFLDEASGRCSCYRDRPLICRAWGTLPHSACPFGCEPDAWLSDEQFEDLRARMIAIGEPELAPTPLAGNRPATDDEYGESTRNADALIARGLRLPDRWDASQPYVICPSCQWRGQRESESPPDLFVGEPCPHCGEHRLRVAGSGDRPLFVPRRR